VFANGSQAENIAWARQLLNAPALQQASNADAADASGGAEPSTLAPSVPLLRRPHHHHHRDVQMRSHPSISADSTNMRDQD
jgi:hypothetical protein